MVEDDPEPALVIRAGGRNIHSSPDDTEQIREAVVVATRNCQPSGSKIMGGLEKGGR